MVNQDDSGRKAEMGPGLLTLCVLLLLLAAFSVFQTVLVIRAGEEFIARWGDDPEGLIAQRTLLTGLNVIFYLGAAIALYFSRSQLAVWLTAGATLYANHFTLAALPELPAMIRMGLQSPLVIVDLLIMVGIIVYLLLSKSVERVYGTGSRDFILRRIPALWQRGRGRPTSQEIEAERLNNTFS